MFSNLLLLPAANTALARHFIFTVADKSDQEPASGPLRCIKSEATAVAAALPSTTSQGFEMRVCSFTTQTMMLHLSPSICCCKLTASTAQPLPAAAGSAGGAGDGTCLPAFAATSALVLLPMLAEVQVMSWHPAAQTEGLASPA